MKKIASLTVAIGLMTSIAATASAAEVTGVSTGTDTGNGTTVTQATYNQFETIITPDDLKPATPQIIVTKATPFHFTADSSTTPAGWVSAQTLDTTGLVVTDGWGNEWREIYTWLGKAWIKVPASAYVITP
jgi:hypothetical protein